MLEEGDIFNIPTGIFRGFENIGLKHGMLMAIIGGDDAGGGVVWAPQVVEEAKDHGLILAETGRLYDSKKGESLPEGVGPMPLLTDEELASYPELPASSVVPRYIGRRLDMEALAAKRPAKVIGEDAMIVDKPGFEVEFLARGSVSADPWSARQDVVAHGIGRALENRMERRRSRSRTRRHLRGAERHGAFAGACGFGRGGPFQGAEHRRCGRSHMASADGMTTRHWEFRMRKGEFQR